jgi:hypothetical protein
LRIEEVPKFPSKKAAPTRVKAELETAEKSLTWIRQPHCPFSVCCV